MLLFDGSQGTACSCAPPAPAGEAAEANEWVFIGRQIDKYEGQRTEDDGSWGEMRLIVEVLTVYKGDVPDTVELRTGYGSADCGVDLSYRDSVGLTLTPNDDGTVSISSCGGTYPANDIRWLYEDFPKGTGSGEPGFLVGIDAGRARIALLDELGQLIRYVEGNGRLADAAICPGSNKIVEMVQLDRSWRIGGDEQPWLEVRDVRSLEIEAHHELEISERDRSQLNGMGWVLDMQCHDSEADLFSYLLPSGVWDSWAGANLPGPAELHIWRSGELSAVPAGEARTIAVDPEGALFYAITGPDGRTLEIRDLAGRLLETMPVPLGHQAWKLALSPDHSKLAILTRDVPMASENWFYAEVNSMLVMDVETRGVEEHDLPAAGFAQVLEARSDGFTTATYQWEPPTMTIASVTADSVEVLGSYPADGLHSAIAIGTRTMLLTDIADQLDPVLVAVDPATDRMTPIADMTRSRVAVAFPGTVPTAEPVPVATTTTSEPAMPVALADAPPTSDAPPDEDGASQADGAATPVAAPEDDGNDTTAVAIVAAGVTLALVALVILAARRRRPS